MAATAEASRNPLEINLETDLHEWRKEQDENLVNLQSATQHLYYTLVRERNQTTHAASLPPEILAEIFSYSNTIPLIKISGVCHSWRTAVLNHPVLWSRGCISDQYPYISQLMIERSAAAPLDIHVDNKGKSAVLYRSSWLIPSVMGRIQSICHILDQDFGGKMPNLRSLHLLVSSRSTTEAITPTQYPSLRHLSLGGQLSFSLEGLAAMKELRTLHLAYIEQPLHALQLAIGLPCLKELSVTGTGLQSPFVPPPINFDVHGHALSSLKLLRLLNMYAMHIGQFLERLIYHDAHKILGSPLSGQDDARLQGAPLGGAGTVWIHNIGERPLITYERSTSLIQMDLSTKFCITIPSPVSLDTVLVLYVLQMGHFQTLSFVPLVGLRRLVLEIARDYPEVEAENVASLLNLDLITSCGNLEVIQIMFAVERTTIKPHRYFRRRDYPTSTSTPNFSNQSVASWEGVYDFRLDYITRWGKEYREEEEPFPDISEEGAASHSSDDNKEDNGEPITHTRSNLFLEMEHELGLNSEVVPTDHMVLQFLDMWFTGRGARLNCLIIQDSVNPKRWENIASQLSEKVLRLELSSQVDTLCPPVSHPVRCFSPYCDKCPIKDEADLFN